MHLRNGVFKLCPKSWTDYLKRCLHCGSCSGLNLWSAFEYGLLTLTAVMLLIWSRVSCSSCSSPLSAISLSAGCWRLSRLWSSRPVMCLIHWRGREREQERERCVCVDVSMDERRRVEINVGWKQGKIIRTQSKTEQEREQKWRAGHRGERVGEEHWRLIDVHILYRRAGNIILLKRSAHKHTRAADTESCCSPIQ